jgi:hypothetical protein
MLSEELQRKEIHKHFNKQNPTAARVPSTAGVSSSGLISQYDTLRAISQHIRVDVVRGLKIL